MRKSLLKWSPKWLPSLHDPGPPRLWRIGYALTACFAIAVAGLVALWVAALVLLNHPVLPRSRVISLHDTVGVAQLVFASVAGAGALVALVTAYRRQRVGEASSAHDRTRVLNERFTATASQLGDDQPAVRLAGVHAMAGLADDWKENRQTCVDVLCAYLRLPYDPDPGLDASPADRAANRANREVRHTIIRLICRHLRPDAAVSWQGLNFDFTGVVFDGGNFTNARFSGGIVRFSGSSFVSGRVSFKGAEFSGGEVLFDGAEFSGAQVSFGGAKFSGAAVSFSTAEFSSGTVSFTAAESYSGGELSFVDVFDSGLLYDMEAKAQVTGSTVGIHGAQFSDGKVVFDAAKFSGAKVSFDFAVFSGGEVSFDFAVFSGGEVSFDLAVFSGGAVSFSGAKFSGGTVDFRLSRDWSRPPYFAWGGTPPAGVTLPTKADAQAELPDLLRDHLLRRPVQDRGEGTLPDVRTVRARAADSAASAGWHARASLAGLLAFLADARARRRPRSAGRPYRAALRRVAVAKPSSA